MGGGGFNLANSLRAPSASVTQLVRRDAELCCLVYIPICSLKKPLFFMILSVLICMNLHFDRNFSFQFINNFLFLLGYKKRRIAFFLVGAIGTGCLTYLVSLSESKFSSIIHVLLSVAAGLFFSLFSTTVLYIGYFVTSLFAGLALGFAAMLLYTTFQLFHSVAVPCVVIAAVSLIQVFITLWWRRVLLITSTSVLGASMLAGGLDYFIERLFILKYMEAKIFYSKIAPLCWYSFVVLAIWPALFIAGMLVQLLWTGKEKHKTNYVFIYRRKKRNREENFALTSRDGSFE